MSVFLLCVVLVLVGTNSYTLVKFSKVRGQLENGPTPDLGGNSPKALTSPNHQLKKTFVDRNIKIGKDGSQDFYGWHFWCSCGSIAPASDNGSARIGMGSEAGAVRAWHKHTALYAQLVDDTASELELCKKELETQKANCICKDL